MNLLQNQTAIITGATRGIGRAIAIRFAQEGCNIIFTGRSRGANMEETEKQLRDLGVQAYGFASNASNLQDAQALVAEAVKLFGGVDILINNAGITADAALKRMTEEQWDQVIDTNLRSVFCMSKAVQPVMWKQNHGSIINISSVVGIAGNYNQTNYAASKAGILGFTKAACKELGARNIRVNAIAPGVILTEMTQDIPDAMKEYWNTRIPLHRPGKPEEVANACLFYASELGSYCTGDIMHLCGGMEDA